MEFPEAAVVSMRLADIDPRDISVGATPDKCVLCGEEVSIALSSRNVLTENPEYKIVCMVCYEAAGHDPIKGCLEQLLDMRPDQLAELIAHFAREDARNDVH